MVPMQIHTTLRLGGTGWGSATIRPIRVIRGEQHALSPFQTPHSPQGYRLGDATRMTRKKRVTADHLRGVRLAAGATSTWCQCKFTPRYDGGGIGWRSATICPIRVIRGELHALSPFQTPHPRQGHRLGDATRMMRKKTDCRGSFDGCAISRWGDFNMVPMHIHTTLHGGELGGDPRRSAQSA